MFSKSSGKHDFFLLLPNFWYIFLLKVKNFFRQADFIFIDTSYEEKKIGGSLFIHFHLNIKHVNQLVSERLEVK